jgi:8-oxo-dGTP pyrophosphatase MutT (NUDIX family)
MLNCAVEIEELDYLHQLFGTTPHLQYRLTVDTPFLNGDNQLLTSGTRRAEICYVMHRGDPQEAVLLHRKAFYPLNAYRLPTGGIHQGESVIETLVREIEEETSFHLALPPAPSTSGSPTGTAVVLQAFLGTLAYDLYHRSQGRVHTFATYHFLVAAPADALPVSLDPEEQIADWLWRSAEEMNSTAERLETIGEVDPAWSDWGKFRALSHRFVAESMGRLS